MPEAVFDIGEGHSFGDLLHQVIALRRDGAIDDYSVVDAVALAGAHCHIKVSAGPEGIDAVSDLLADEPRVIATVVCDSCLGSAATMSVSDAVGEESFVFALCRGCVKAGKDVRLSEEQLELIPPIVEKWVRIGVSTEPADRRAAERAVALAYESIGLAPPACVVWLGSPLAGMLVGSLIQALQGEFSGTPRTRLAPRADWAVDCGALIKGSLSPHASKRYVEMSIKADAGPLLLAQARARVADSIRSRVWGAWSDDGYPFRKALLCVSPQLRRSNQMPRDAAMEQFGSRAWRNFCSQAGAAFEVPAEDGSWETISERAWSDPDEEGRTLTMWSGIGADDLHESGLSEYLESIGFDQARALEPARQLLGSCGYCWPFERLAILIERPKRLCLDSQGRLHHEHGAALEYADGYESRAIHGEREPIPTLAKYPRAPGRYWFGSTDAP